ncbi:MAG: hypothetical protein WD941_05340 [Opitutus sp.]
MNVCRILLAVLLAQGALPAADPPAAGAPVKPAGKKWSIRDAVRALMLQEAKKSPPATPEPKAAKDTTVAVTAPAGPPKSRPASSEAASQQPPPVVLPQVDVRNARITGLDQQLASQEKAIARERKNIAATEGDKALNDMRIAKPLAIFGGESTQFRQHVATERVELMEAEKDLIEAIAHARTPGEKAELQKQLNELKAMRRELDRTLR